MEELTFSRRDIKPGISCYHNHELDPDGGTSMPKDQQTSAISISLRPKAASDISESDASIFLVATVEYKMLTSNLESHR